MQRWACIFCENPNKIEPPGNLGSLPKLPPYQPRQEEVKGHTYGAVHWCCKQPCHLFAESEPLVCTLSLGLSTSSRTHVARQALPLGEQSGR